MHDIAIRNALICDGSGEPAYRGEIGIVGEKISALGPLVGEARQEIDARGLVVSPGIIDSHTHYDAQITWDATASPSLSLGVTTLIMGNCGFTIAPCRPQDREQTLRNLTQVEGMSLDALLTGTRSDYQTFDEYLEMIESLGMVPNVAVYCGHSSIRTWVMGADATKRTATAAEVSEMKSLIAAAIKSGAIGFSTSTFEAHNGWGGIPMPSRFADASELRALVGTLGELGAGRFMLTKGRDTSIGFLESIAADTGRPVIVAAIQYNHATPNRASDDMAAIGAAVNRGRKMIGQVACTAISMEFTLTSAYLFESMQAWQPAIALYPDKKALAQFYRDPTFRSAMKAELTAANALNRFTDQWDKLEILSVANKKNRAFEHRNIAELAQADNKHPLDWILDFGEQENFETLFNAQILNADEDAVLKLLKDPNASIGLADAGAHLFLFCDADYGLHLLGRWHRERGDFTLEEAVAALTSKPAAIYGIKDRGLLKTGHFADLLMFNPETVGRGEKTRVADLPAGASRLIRSASGIHGIWVNGRQVANEAGLMADANKPGRLLREFNQ